jgi:O-succinylbenzoate synthase
VRVAGIELIELRLPLQEPFATGTGSRSTRRILLVRIEGEEGADGWGECVAGEAPTYTYETTETAWHVLSEFILPPLTGREILGPEEIAPSAGRIRGHPMAKAAAEMAVWDLQAKELGAPLWELLGGSGEAVEVGVVVGFQPTEEALLERVRGHVEAGYARIKLKIEPGRDIGPVRAVRDRFPDVPLMVDASCSYALSDVPRLRELDPFRLTMIEQPLGDEDLREHAILQAEIETPICLDESIRSADDTLLALQIGACRIVNVKPGRVGGLANAKAIHDVCRSREVPLWCGGMLESGIGRAHNLALATLPGFTLPGDISESRRYWERDLVTPEFELENGRLAVPQGPGIGVEPDRERIRDLAVRTAAFGRLTRPVAV